MSHDKHPDWEIQIYVPQTAVTQAPSDDAVTTQSIRSFFMGGSVEAVDGAALQKQWKKMVDDLLRLTSAVGSATNDWTLDSIEIGLTLSAKGELLFIAEAGAEASVKMALKRKPKDPAGPTPAPSA